METLKETILKIRSQYYITPKQIKILWDAKFILYFSTKVKQGDEPAHDITLKSLAHVIFFLKHKSRVSGIKVWFKENVGLPFYTILRSEAKPD
jgi:hypothetical protein